MINSDRVTSSSDDLSHVIASSPPSAARRHGDDDVIADVDNAGVSHDRRHAVSASASTMFAHLQPAAASMVSNKSTSRA